MFLSHLSFPSDTTRSLSAEVHSCFDNNTRSLSPREVTHSIRVLRCPHLPVPFAAASCARSEVKDRYGEPERGE
jgi:hypothetical protein